MTTTRINWAFFPKLPERLAIGEERYLDAGEVREINFILSEMWQDNERLRDLLSRVRKRREDDLKGGKS